MRCCSLYKILFPNSPVPASPFFDDCMSKEQYKAEVSQKLHDCTAVQPTKTTAQPSAISSSTLPRCSSLCSSSASSSLSTSQDAGSSRTSQRSSSQKTAQMATNRTSPSSGSSTTSHNPSSTCSNEQHSEAQIRFLERQILKRLSTIQGAMLQRSNSSALQMILVLRQLDAGLSELERLSAYTLHVSAEVPGLHPHSTLSPDPVRPGDSTFSAESTSQAINTSSAPTNADSVNPQQPSIFTSEPRLSN